MRNYILVLGDQLSRDSAAFEGFEPAQDAVWMAETVEESTHVWASKTRLASFFSPMRHFRDELRARGETVHYHALAADPAGDAGTDFAEILARNVAEHRPERLVVLRPGDFRVRDMIHAAASDLGVPLDEREDADFFCGIDEFAAWAEGRKSLLMETFYRTMRKKHKILLEDDGEPIGGAWNFDADNREAFGKAGPDEVKRPRRFGPDETTDEVVAMIEARFPDHPGTAEHFDLPVTRKQALAYLREFVDQRLPTFGRHQDAMWQGGDFHSHSRLSNAINVKLLSPREVVAAAVDAYHSGHAPLNSVEGFVRQIIGWREYVRGVYWLKGPEYLDANVLGCEDPVPQFFWDGETDMACAGDAMRIVLNYGYAHHIQRLMVLGLFAQLAGVRPRDFHDWHMAMYCDAIDWASAPNTIGMSQWGDGGVVGSKPYCATGKYIDRMSNHCGHCKYDPKKALGPDACPFTTLYWDFLDRNRPKLERNHRMGLQVRNLDRKPDLADIRKQAGELRERLAAGGRV